MRLIQMGQNKIDIMLAFLENLLAFISQKHSYDDLLECAITETTVIVRGLLAICHPRFGYKETSIVDLDELWSAQHGARLIVKEVCGW